LIAKFTKFIAENTEAPTLRKAALDVVLIPATGKKPSDAVKMVYAARKQVNILRKQRGLKPVKRYSREDGMVTPAIVFINTGFVLDGLAEIATKFDSKKSAGDLYDVKIYKNKTPSDVYASAD
jgi:hypothetical protein